MASPLDDALRRTSDACARYRVAESMIALAAGSLLQMPPDLRARSGTGALIDALLETAGAHGGPHDNCRECAAVRNGLAVAMGVVRAEADIQLNDMLGE